MSEFEAGLACEGGRVRRRVVFVLAAAALSGCTSVKLVQRDGCWLRQTKKVFSSSEELGPCGRPEPKWSEDRLTRVTQECVAQADYRWQSRSLEAWNRGQPLPERPSDDTVLKDCMDQVSRSQLAENERLRQRLEELDADKAALAERADQDRSDLLAGYDEKMTADLGRAARRPASPAIATATARSEGRTTSEGRSSSDRGTEPKAVLALPAPASAPRPPPSSRPRSRRVRLRRAVRRQTTPPQPLPTGSRRPPPSRPVPRGP